MVTDTRHCHRLPPTIALHAQAPASEDRAMRSVGAPSLVARSSLVIPFHLTATCSTSVHPPAFVAHSAKGKAHAATTAKIANLRIFAPSAYRPLCPLATLASPPSVKNKRPPPAGLLPPQGLLRPRLCSRHPLPGGPWTFRPSRKFYGTMPAAASFNMHPLRSLCSLTRSATWLGSRHPMLPALCSPASGARRVESLGQQDTDITKVVHFGAAQVGHGKSA